MIYRNPIIDADFPDPDACRVGDEFFLTCSSFNRAPGLPVLRSRNLVDWEFVAHALSANVPSDWYDLPRHGMGVWAPAIRHHDGLFHIVYPDVDRGIFVVRAPDPAGPWSAPRALIEGVGIIDPCPLWDDDGQTYLVHGWAGSRAGRKNVLTVRPVDEGLTRVLGAGRDVIDGDQLTDYRTLEGPKFYKRDGWYWIFAPAGGVAEGWQSVFRSRSPYGPYESRVVMSQGSTAVNGPHQGAWLDAPDGSHWFLHFQDRGVFGRVLHLQPMRWDEDGWPLMGAAVDGGPAEPVSEYGSPLGGVQRRRTLAASDDFRDGIGSQWAWQANPVDGWTLPSPVGREFVAVADDTGNVRTLPHVLGQPLPGIPSTSVVRISLDGPDGARAGIGILGRGYLWAGLRTGSDAGRLIVATRDEGGLNEVVLIDEAWSAESAEIRLDVDGDATISVALRDGDGWRDLGIDYTAVAGHWIGADIVLFAAAPLGGTAGTATFGPFEIEVHDERRDHAVSRQ